jgi:quercetin dioxygenase-like cupin family protein
MNTTRRTKSSALVGAVVLTLAVPATAEESKIFPNGSRTDLKGAEASFTGPVRVELQFVSPESRMTVGHVTFEPGSRSVWHTHPAGQVLIVTSGSGWVQEWGNPKREIKPGDVVWCPPGVKHWHGASATNAMSHTAVTEMSGGKNVDWLEKVSDEQYGK